MGGGEDAQWTAPQTTAQMLNEELADPSSVQSYHIPCEPALMGLTAGRPLSSWAAWPLNLWTARPLIVNRLTAKLVDRLTAELVVVNLVKLQLTKYNQLTNKMCNNKEVIIKTQRLSPLALLLIHDLLSINTYWGLWHENRMKPWFWFDVLGINVVQKFFKHIPVFNCVIKKTTKVMINWGKAHLCSTRYMHCAAFK